MARDTGTADLQGDLVDPTPQLFYRSFAQWDLPPTTVLARTSLDAAGLVGAMQRELRAVNVTLPVISAKTMAQYLEESLVAPKAVATFLGALGALGLCLAGIGLYAVVAFAVSRRSREIGIRMALGARSQQVVWTVAREVALLVGVGTGAGLDPDTAGDPGPPGRHRPDPGHLAVPPDGRSAGAAFDRRLHGDGGAGGRLRARAARGQDGSAGGAPARLTWGADSARPRVVVADGDRREVGADRRVGAPAHRHADRLAAAERRRERGADARVALQVEVLARRRSSSARR